MRLNVLSFCSSQIPNAFRGTDPPTSWPLHRSMPAGSHGFTIARFTIERCTITNSERCVEQSTSSRTFLGVIKEQHRAFRPVNGY